MSLSLSSYSWSFSYTFLFFFLSLFFHCYVFIFELMLLLGSVLLIIQFLFFFLFLFFLFFSSSCSFFFFLFLFVFFYIATTIFITTYTSTITIINIIILIIFFTLSAWSCSLSRPITPASLLLITLSFCFNKFDQIYFFLIPVPCETGWISSNFSGTCLKLVKQRKSWDDARILCQKNYTADLVKIVDSVMNDLIASKKQELSFLN